MMFKQLTVSAAALFGLLAPTALAYTETVEGYKFDHWGPAHDASKFDYELTMAQSALTLFKTRLGDRGSDIIIPTTKDDLPAAKIKLHDLKASTDADGLTNLFKTDISVADAFWHDVASNSTGKWVPIDAQVIAYIPNLSALVFDAWSLSPFADAANNDGNPEHYFKHTKALSPGVVQSTILEGWGGLTTYFDIPTFGAPNHATYPFLRALPDYPVQGAGPKVLKDGSGEEFGVLHLAMRDTEAKVRRRDYPTAEKGLEIYATIWSVPILSPK